MRALVDVLVPLAGLVCTAWLLPFAPAVERNNSWEWSRGIVVARLRHAGSSGTWRVVTPSISLATAATTAPTLPTAPPREAAPLRAGAAGRIKQARTCQWTHNFGTRALVFRAAGPLCARGAVRVSKEAMREGANLKVRRRVHPTA